MRVPPRLRRCWQDEIDLSINRYGWGYDVTFEQACNVSVGVVDSQLAHHPLAEASRSYDSANASTQFQRWMRHKRGGAWRWEVHGLIRTVRHCWPADATPSLKVCNQKRGSVETVGQS